MDEKDRALLNVLLDNARSTMATIASLQATSSITNQIVMRIAARTDILAGLTDEESETIERVLAASLSTVDLQSSPEATTSYVALVRSRMQQP